MANNHSISIATNTQALIKDWLQRERNGVKFPVPFDEAWKIAGYARKDSAKRYLPKSSHGEFFHVSEEKSGKRGRPKEVINLSCDGFKHLCLMADTEAGRQIRQYFIESEKNWQLVQEHYPQVAQDVELEKLKLQNQVLEKQLKLRELDNSMTIMHGKEYVLTLRGHDNQIVEVERKTIEIIDEKHNIRFTGQTLAQIKEELKERFSLKFKSGADVKRYLEKHGLDYLIAQTKRSVVSDYVPSENLEEVYKFLGSSRQQKLIGE